MFVELDITEIIKQRYAEAQGENTDYPSQHVKQEERERAAFEDFVRDKITQSLTSHRDQQHRDDNQRTQDDKHDDGEKALHQPTLQIQTLVSQEVGINITEAVEDSHNAAGTENQTEQNTYGKQSVMGLVHDAVNSVLHIIHCP